MATTVTLDDGRIFPHHDGKVLSWTISGSDQEIRAVVRAMAEHRPDQLLSERRFLIKASFDRMFGHNAKKQLLVVEDEMQIGRAHV